MTKDLDLKHFANILLFFKTEPSKTNFYFHKPCDFICIPLLPISGYREIITKSYGRTKAIVGKLIRQRHFAIWKKRTAEKHKNGFRNWGDLWFWGKSLFFDWQLIGF